MNAPFRPLLRWHGGKWLLAPWIISHFPPHRCYVEPFGGAASVLLRKAPAYAEVYNDLDDNLVNLFRLLRDPTSAAELVRRLELTPFAREEFNRAYNEAPADDPIESARRLIARSFMGFGSDSTSGHYRTGFRCNTTRMGTTPARDWMSYPDALRVLIERLQGVVIEQKPALEILDRFDGEDTIYYVDPPYLSETRSQGNRRRCGPGRASWHVYQHELEDKDHLELLEKLRTVRGMVVLSGYPSPLYAELLPDWHGVSKAAYAGANLATGKAKRTEMLWLNPAVAERLGHSLFAAAAE